VLSNVASCLSKPAEPRACSLAELYEFLHEDGKRHAKSDCPAPDEKRVDSPLASPNPFAALDSETTAPADAACEEHGCHEHTAPEKVFTPCIKAHSLTDDVLGEAIEIRQILQVRSTNVLVPDVVLIYLCTGCRRHTAHNHSGVGESSTWRCISRRCCSCE